MHKHLLLVAGIIFSSYSSHAQIFINTGNAEVERNKNENPNAVIWKEGQAVPIPPNTPAEVKAEIKAVNVEPKSESNAPTKINNEKPVIKKAEPVAKTEEPAEYVKPKVVAEKKLTPDYPADAVLGKCYARCTVADVYETQKTQVIDRPASVKIEKIPARYETVYDTVIVKAASKKIIAIPAEVETITGTELVTPATKKWVKGKVDKNCLSSNPKDCEVWCLSLTVYSQGLQGFHIQIA